MTKSNGFRFVRKLWRTSGEISYTVGFALFEMRGGRAVKVGETQGGTDDATGDVRAFLEANVR